MLDSAGPQELADARGALAAAVARCRAPVLEGEPRDAAAIAAFLNAVLGLALAAPEYDAELLETARRAAERFPDEQDRQRAVIHSASVLARVLARHGRTGEAHALLSETVERTTQAPIELPYLLNQLADLQRMAGSWEESRATLLRCEEALYDLRSAEWIPLHGPARATLLATRAQLYMDLGLPDRAAACVESARLLPESHADAETRFALLLIETHLDLMTDKQARAVQRLDACLAQTVAPALAPAWRATLRLRLGIALSDLEFIDPARPRRAEQELIAALADPELPLDERMRGERLFTGYLLRWGRLEEARAHLLLARELLGRARRVPGTDALPDPAAAILAAYAARLSTLEGADPTRSSACLDELRASYDAFLVRSRDLPMRAGGLGLLQHFEQRFVVGELVRQSVRLEGPERGIPSAWKQLSRVQELGSLTRRLGAASPDLAQFQREFLRPGHGVLVYLPSAAPSLLIAVDRESSRIFDLASKDEIDPLRRGLAQCLADAAGADPASSDAQLERLRAPLSALLLPVESHALLKRWNAVTVVGAELLDGLAFEHLALPGERPLGIEKAIDYLPSLALGPFLRRRAMSARGALAGGAEPSASLWIVAAPAAPEGLASGWPALPEIPFGKREAERLGSAYPKGAVRVLSGREASLERLRDGALHSADVLHMIVHGLADPSRERPAGLCLAPTKAHDGRLFCDQVDGLREDGGSASALRVPPLVVLASCGAARGPMRYGEDGLSHLGGAFLYAGASCVVLSRHDLDSDFAQRFGERFHARLRQGDSPAEAARSAREHLLENGLAHAWQIALMQVLGDGQRAVFPR